MKLKDPLDGLTHLIGALLAIPGMIILIVLGSDSAWKVVSFSIYGASLFLLYTFSTLYHWLPEHFGGKNQVFRKLDHLAIYALIAGTYTPFCLLSLRGAWGWSIFGVTWGLALIFIVLQSIFIDLPRWLTTSVYVAMGWLIVVGINPLVHNLAPGGLRLLLAGGVIYSLGGVIYTIKKPNFSKHFNYHSLWHVFVLGGSICHYFAMLFYLT